jgi:hypothetical protein
MTGPASINPTGITIVVMHSPQDHDDALLQLCSSFGDVAAFARTSFTQVEVTYEEQEDADAACGNLNGMPFHDVYLHVQSLQELRRAAQQKYSGRGRGGQLRQR